MLYAYGEATVQKITVTLRKSYAVVRISLWDASNCVPTLIS